LWIFFLEFYMYIAYKSVLCEYQGVVTYTSPVEAFATGIKNLDRWKSSLIAWSLHSEARLIALRKCCIYDAIIDHTPHE